MPEYSFDQIREHVVRKLGHLKPDLTYHCIEHTLDVLEQALRIAREENMRDDKDLELLKIASLYHDIGFLKTYLQHEKQSVEIFREDFRDSSMSESDKETIAKLIMVTQIPQQPKNKLEQIICDADLDYLGRSDFADISENLRKEFLAYGIVSTDEEWFALQLKFLQNHQYHTAASRDKREPVKKQNYLSLLTV